MKNQLYFATPRLGSWQAVGSVLLALAIFSGPPVFAANVTINASDEVSTVAPTAFGVHTSVYDNENGNSSLPSLLIQSGIKALRYPGGGYADIFHWSVTKPSL